MAKDQAPPTPQCPRCGYDQSGLIATWESACPLAGVCSECGYEFHWREVLNPEQRRLDGFVEHCPWKLVPLVAFRTLAWAWLPWVLWRRVKLHHEVVPKRLLAWLAVVLIGWHVVNAGLAVVSQYVLEYQVRSYVQSQSKLYAIPFEINKAELLVNALVWPVLRYDPWVAQGSLGGTGLSLAANEWPPPWHILTLATLAFPIAFILLRGSRKLNRIRSVHVLRAAVYSFAWVGTLLLLWTVLVVLDIVNVLTVDLNELHSSWLGLVQQFIEYFFEWAPYALLVWLGLYWLLAMKIGWSFRNPFYHWLLISMVVLLASAAGARAINPQAYHYFLW